MAFSYNYYYNCKTLDKVSRLGTVIAKFVSHTKYKSQVEKIEISLNQRVGWKISLSIIIERFDIHLEILRFSNT